MPRNRSTVGILGEVGIDWEQAAYELKQDYTEVNFDGVSYWIRS
jgi:hypothetical protein